MWQNCVANESYTMVCLSELIWPENNCLSISLDCPGPVWGSLVWWDGLIYWKVKTPGGHRVYMVYYQACDQPRWTSLLIPSNFIFQPILYDDGSRGGVLFYWALCCFVMMTSLFQPVTPPSSSSYTSSSSRADQKSLWWHWTEQIWHLSSNQWHISWLYYTEL